MKFELRLLLLKYLQRKRLKINCGASAIASKIVAAQVPTSENDKLANPLISS